MRRDKKIISIILSIVIVITSCSVAFFAKSQKKEVNINMEILDSLIKDRYWVIETLVTGNISNNPYSVIDTASTGENIMDEVLENYQNDEAFKTLVDAMEIYSNTGQYISGVADSVIETITGWFGDSDAVDKAVASTDELKYESILNEVLKTDYSSSWGDTLFEENMDMECLKQRSEILKKLDKYQTTLKDIVGLSFSDSSSVVIYDPYNSVDDTYEMDIEDYVGHFLDAYEQDLENYLMGIIEIPAIEGNEALKKKILSIGALGLVSAYERTVIPACDYSLDDVYYDGMFEDTMKIINGAGGVLTFADKTMDMAILLEALQSQKNTTVKTMSRICENTNDEDLEKVLDNYADLLNSAGDKGALAYESFANYLRNEQVVTNIVKKKVKEIAPNLIKKAANKYAGATTIALSNAIAKSIALVDLTVWVADQVTGIQDTAKKIYICKYLNKIIDETVKVFLKDKKAYEEEKTDENAEKMLSDLQFLKELRLYGEKSAYGSMCAQMESWIGIMLGGGDTKEYLDRRYQASIDTYLGCTFNPVTNNEFSLSKGDVLYISSEDVNGKTYSYARLKKADGELSYFAEADLRLMGGIDLNGATVNILSAPNGIYLPIVDNDEIDSEINIYCDNVAFGTINNTSSMTIEIHKEDKTFEITDSINNSGKLNIKNSLYSSKIPVYEISNTNQINIENCVLQCKGTPTNNGTINGMVEICGGEEAYKNAYFTMGIQTMLGNGVYSDLYFTNRVKQGIKINGKQYVSNYLSNTGSRLRTSENIVLTDNCSVSGNKFNTPLSFENYTSTAPLTLNDVGIIYDNVTFSSNVAFNDGLIVSSSCKTLTINHEINVKGDMEFAGGNITGNDWLKLHNDLYVTASSPTISNLDFVGVLPQNVNGNSFSVGSIANHNVLLNGVNLSSQINITKKLWSERTTAYKNPNNLVLTGDARLNNDTIIGGISARNWNCSNSATINGIMYGLGDVNINNNATLKADTYAQNNGTLNINSGSTLHTKVDFGCNGKVVNNGEIIVDGDVSNLNEIENNASMTFKGDCNVSKFTGGTLNAYGNLNTNGTVNIKNLNINSDSAQVFTNSGSGSVKVENLNINNKSNSGFTAKSGLYVTNHLTNNAKHISNGDNIMLTGNATLKDNSTCSKIGASNWTCTTDTVIKGTLKMVGNNSIAQDCKLTCANFEQPSGSLTINENAQLNCNGDYRQSGTVTNNSEVNIMGDAQISGTFTGGTLHTNGNISASSSMNLDSLIFESSFSQSFSNSSSTNVNNLSINNSSKDGFTVESKIFVEDMFTNNCKRIINDENIVLKNKTTGFINGKLKGNLTIDDEFVVSNNEQLTIVGKLILKSGARLVIEDGSSLTVNGPIKCSSSIITVNENGLLEGYDYLSSSSDKFNIDGDMIIKGDSSISSSTVNANGLITFKGDLNVSSGTWNKPNIAFVSKLPQVVSGSSINVNNLIVDNDSKTGIDFKSVVNYYGEYDGNNSNIKNETKLVEQQ